MNKLYDLGNQPSLKSQVYRVLHEMIVHGDLKPGERITEEELSQSMGISRAPIREGLSMLEKDGFIEIVPRKGAVVTPVTEKLVEEIWMCRIALEPFAAREAIGNIPTGEAERILRGLTDILESNPVDSDKYIQSDLDVHGLYFNFLDNQMMRTILENLWQHSFRARWLNEQLHSDSASIKTSTEEHIDIVKAILEKDSAGTYSAVLCHLNNSKDRLVHALHAQDNDTSSVGDLQKTTL